jgi:hypothetical protein
MPIVTIIITLIVIGVLLWLVEKFIPMDATIKTIIRVVVIILVVLWLLSIFGLLGSLGAIHTHRLYH